MSLRDVTRKALNGMRKAQTSRGQLDEAQLDEGVRAAEKVISDHAKGLPDGHHKALTDIHRDPALRGVHFKHVMKAAENLHKKGVIAYDGNLVSPTKTTDVKEARSLKPIWHHQRPETDKAAEEAGSVHAVYHGVTHAEYHFNNSSSAADFKTHLKAKGLHHEEKPVTDHESKQRSGSTIAIHVHESTLDENLHANVNKSLAHHGMDGHKLFASASEGYSHLHAALAKHDLALDDHIHDHGGAALHSQNYRLKKLDGTAVDGSHLHVARTGGVGDREGADGSDHPMKGRHEFNAYLHGKKLKEGTDGMIHDHVLHHPAAEAGVHAALKHVGGKSHGISTTKHGEQVHHFSFPKGKSHEFGAAYHAHGLSKIPEKERTLGHWHIPCANESAQVPAPKQAGPGRKVKGGHEFPVKRADGRVVTVHVPTKEAAEPTFAERVIAAAKGAQSVAEAVPTEAPAELVAALDSVEAEGMSEATVAAFGLVDSMKVEELAHADHHVDVHYRLTGTAAAKQTVHHLITHAKKHGAHGYDADGYEGHIRFKFKSKDHAAAFHKTAGDARDVHRATLAHHEAAYEGVEEAYKANPERTASLDHHMDHAEEHLHHLARQIKAHLKDYHKNPTGDHVTRMAALAHHLALARGHLHGFHDESAPADDGAPLSESELAEAATFAKMVDAETDHAALVNMHDRLRRLASSPNANIKGHAHYHKLADKAAAKAAAKDHQKEIHHGGKNESVAAVQDPAPVDPATVSVPSDGNAAAPTPGSIETVVVRLITPMGDAHEAIGTLLHVFGGKPSAGGGYDFPKRTAQAFVNKYMAQGGKAYIIGADGAKHGPNEDADDLLDFDPIAEGRKPFVLPPIDHGPHIPELHAKAPAAGFDKSQVDHMYHLKTADGSKTITVSAHHSGAKVAVHHKQVGSIAIPAVTHHHPSVDAALAHAKKLHGEG